MVTDPPAGIAFMGKEWDRDKGGRGPWVAWMTDVARECLRVLKPGGHALVWALPRTSHWTAWAWEDAGFEVRDRVSHLTGQGFPKSLNVSAAIDKAAGAEREVVGERRWTNAKMAAGNGVSGLKQAGGFAGEYEAERVAVPITAPATEAAKQWDGWGTALKPACEDWWLCRKPLAGTVAANVTEYGTGALNIDGCRIEAPEGVPSVPNIGAGRVFQGDRARGEMSRPHAAGRWPANVVHDGSPEVLAGFPNSKDGVAVQRNGGGQTVGSGRCYSGFDGGMIRPDAGYGGSGSAARFFYCAKASKADRGSDNAHPTVKPHALMRWLCRLITPPGGTVLDCFMGSGSTGKAAVAEGFNFIGIEQSPEYFATAQERVNEARPPQPLLIPA